ncbi:unnamed protein product, partial [Brenthis ino]
MSDSDEDLMPESVTRLQHHAFMNRRAPNMNNTNITSFSFGNNTMTSTYTSKYERQRNGMQHSNQMNMYNRRETSPMSLKSFPDSGMQHFPNFPNRMTSCNRSVFNGRSGSPMSTRSIDSNVSAADIVVALKNVKFNEKDLRLIKEAYNKFIKKRTRKRIEKRRNLKLFLKGYRRKSGEDSGEQGSDSSISSDDCRSTRTFYKQNRSRYGSKSTITDITHFRSTLRESDMFRDCTERFQQTKLRNMYAVNNTNVNHADNDTIIHQNHKKFQEKPQPNMSMVTLKDRFTKSANSFLLPSQRFNMSTKNPKNGENSTNVKRDVLRTKNNIILEEHSKSLDSDRDEIFSEITIRENTHIQQKRVHEDSEINGSDKKRYKAAPQTNLNDLTSMTNSDFNFKKPQMPVRKSGNHKKDSAPERIIAMSKPLIGNIDLDIPKKLPKHLDDTQNKLPVNSTEIEESTNQTETTQNSTDVSMRPSFIKRKLFTQKLDVAENNNISSDNIGANSPQANMYSECREKNKVRKLVASQSCLSRDILGDDNVLDLIHKIVPPDKINMTTASNKKEVNNSNDNDKWDVTSVISTCDVGDVSDTFTDEEIFKAPCKLDNRAKKDQKVSENVAGNNTILPKPVTNKLMTQCNVVVKKLSPLQNSKQKQSENEGDKSKFPNKRTVSSCIRSFWDTDFESDMEDRTATPWKPKIQLNSGDNSKMNFSKKSATKGSILTIRSLQNKTVNSSMRSDISRVSKRNIESQENKENNNMLNKNNKNLKNNEKEDETQPKEKDLKNIKSKQKNETTKMNNEKPKAKPAQTKTKSMAAQNSKKDSPCNTSRESLRLRQKNESKVNTISSCNTSRESLRLKQKNENKIDNTLNNDIVKRLRGRPRKSAENVDSIKSNLNKNSKETKKNKKTNDKCVKKNATLNRTKEQTPQRKQNVKLFTTPITDSSFNISNRSLRIRHR